MIYKLFIVSFLVINITFWTGCTPSNVTYESRYKSYIIDSALKNNGGLICVKLQNVDTLFYDEYNIMTFTFLNMKENKIDTVLFVVLSSKKGNDTININEYETVKENEEYCLELMKESTPISAQFRIRGQEFSYKHYLDKESNLVFYEKGYIVADVYKSKNIKGIYILKDKRKDK